MKKYIAYAAAIGLALPVSFAIPAPVYANHDGQTAFCKAILDSGGEFDFGFGPFQFNNLGECVSFVTQREFSQVQICKGTEAGGFFDALGLKNFGDCMVNYEFDF